MDVKTSKNTVLAALFGNDMAISIEERARVVAELEEIGALTFSLNKDEDGWVAQCKEVPGIIAGGSSLNPSAEEIETEIRSAIYAAFNVQHKTEEKRSPYFGMSDFAFVYAAS